LVGLIAEEKPEENTEHQAKVAREMLTYDFDRKREISTVKGF
jgi:hypothetical protein